MRMVIGFPFLRFLRVAGFFDGSPAAEPPRALDGSPSFCGCCGIGAILAALPSGNISGSGATDTSVCFALCAESVILHYRPSTDGGLTLR